MDWSYLAWELPSETRYWRRGRGKDIVTGRRGRRRKQLLDYLKDTRGCRKLKQEALDRTVWTRFGRGNGRVVRQWMEEWLKERMNDWLINWLIELRYKILCGIRNMSCSNLLPAIRFFRDYGVLLRSLKARAELQDLPVVVSQSTETVTGCHDGCRLCMQWSCRGRGHDKRDVYSTFMHLTRFSLTSHTD